LQVQIGMIQSKVESASQDACAICYESKNPCLTPCCSKVFCAECILEWMRRSSACPLCRTSFTPSSLIQISDRAEQTDKKIQTLPKKLDALIQILEENPNGKFLVFSRFENPFARVKESLGARFPVALLQGNKDVIAHTVDSFENGGLKVLLLNSRNAAAGINLPSATHIILLHKMELEEERQILGRAYRLGRSLPLHFIQLLHEKE
jgi:superfamily II DNA/RNA helicase